MSCFGRGDRPEATDPASCCHLRACRSQTRRTSNRQARPLTNRLGSPAASGGL